MTTADPKGTEASTARVVVTFRVGASGKAAYETAAAKQGYDDGMGEGYGYTAWARDVLAAEALTPKHKPTPKPPTRKGGKK